MSTILAINPGSTSTKLGLFCEEEELASINVTHPREVVTSPLTKQKDFRLTTIQNWVKENQVGTLSAVIGRGGLLKPVCGGLYTVTPSLISTMEQGLFGRHAANLGAGLAHAIATPLGIPCYIATPITTDELGPLARYSGTPTITRTSAFHALNQKAVAAEVIKRMGIPYQEANLIVAHLGGGISIGVHAHGKVVDVNHGINEGPFSPERAGGVPSLELAKLCFAPEATFEKIERLLKGGAGLRAYLGSSDLRLLRERSRKEPAVKEVLEAMAYQISKEIASCAAVLCGRVDAIILTGGIAHSSQIVEWIRERISFIAPIFILAGEWELQAMARDAAAALRGDLKPLTYT